jgi:hypothetical protein
LRAEAIHTPKHLPKHICLCAAKCFANSRYAIESGAATTFNQRPSNFFPGLRRYGVNCRIHSLCIAPRAICQQSPGVGVLAYAPPTQEWEFFIHGRYGIPGGNHRHPGCRFKTV